jgi:hypothetical protein
LLFQWIFILPIYGLQVLIRLLLVLTYRPKRPPRPAPQAAGLLHV